jgi:hypothetical protein
MKYFYRLLCIALLVGIAAPSLAQQPPQGTPTRIRGTVEKLEGQALTVKTREGPSIVIALAPNAAVRSVLKRSLSDIKQNDFIASTSVREPDGKLRALEVHIFTEQQRGVVPELQAPWDLVHGHGRPVLQDEVPRPGDRGLGAGGHPDRHLRSRRHEPA